MPYSDFKLDDVVSQFKLTLRDADLFSPLTPIEPSDWLTQTLSFTRTLGRRSDTEKSRSEFMVAPILAEVERANPDRVAVYSGKMMDADKSLGLNGECDFLLGRGAATSLDLRCPIFSVVEAKRQDLKLGVGQCVAQMIGAQIFNQNHREPLEDLFGCVTTGDLWQFYKLSGSQLTCDTELYYLNQVDRILGVFQSVLAEVQPKDLTI
jgi:hypothetical protein